MHLKAKEKGGGPPDGISYPSDSSSERLSRQHETVRGGMKFPGSGVSSALSSGIGSAQESSESRKGGESSPSSSPSNRPYKRGHRRDAFKGRRNLQNLLPKGMRYQEIRSTRSVVRQIHRTVTRTQPDGEYGSIIDRLGAMTDRDQENDGGYSKLGEFTVCTMRGSGLHKTVLGAGEPMVLNWNNV